MIHREEVAALDPARYGLTGRDKKYDVDGILWTKRVGKGQGGEEIWTLEQIERHLKHVYIDNIGYEVCSYLCSKNSRVTLKDFDSICTRRLSLNDSGSLTSWSHKLCLSLGTNHYLSLTRRRNEGYMNCEQRSVESKVISALFFLARYR